MSLMLLATTVFDRMRARARLWLFDPGSSAPERPADTRRRLRLDVIARGGDHAEIESIRGNCPDQMRQQIGDLSRWLESHRAAVDVR
jgi:hypothetical protein